MDQAERELRRSIAGDIRRYADRVVQQSAAEAGVSAAAAARHPLALGMGFAANIAEQGPTEPSLAEDRQLRVKLDQLHADVMQDPDVQAALRQNRSSTPWRPGDPCGSCGSIATYLDDDGVAGCCNCHRSDADE